MRPEIAIAGAGPAGCTLALLAHAAGRCVALFESRARDAAPRAARPIALSHASRLILERAGAWETLPVTPIHSIHVSQAGTWGRTLLSARDASVPALGYVIDYAALGEALAARVSQAGIAIAYGATDDDAAAQAAPLTVHAEGGCSDADTRRYAQHAVIAMVTAEPAASDTAYERFTPQGPLALLPLAGRYGLVWSTTGERAAELLRMSAQEFLSALALAAGERAGRLVAIEARQSVPLLLRVRAKRTGERAAYIGNAAQTLHPVAGQGLNLGLRDAWELAQAVRGAADPGSPQRLRRYAAARRCDAYATICLTDQLARRFLGHDPLLRTLRGLALVALDASAPARRFFARRMIFGTSAIP